jgi:hypothetical protein
VNSFDRELAESRALEGHFRPIGRREIPTSPLADVLAAHLPPARSIDFLNVDAEGLDLEVLRSNDWSRFRPKVVLAEDSESFRADDLGRSEVVVYMRDWGYRPCAKCLHTLILADESRLANRPDRFFLEDGEDRGGLSK